MSDTGDLVLHYEFENDPDVQVIVRNWTEPMNILSALKTAGSDESLNHLLTQMRAQAQ